MKSNFTGIKNLYPYIKKNKYKIIVYILLSIITGFLSSIPTLMIGYIIDMVANPNKLSGVALLLYNIFDNKIILLLIIFGLVLIMVSILNTIFGYFVSQFGVLIKKAVQKDIFTKIINNYDPDSSFLREGDLITRVTKDIGYTSQIIITPFNGFIRDIIEIIWTIIIFFVWNWEVALTAIIFIFPVYFISTKIGNTTKKYSGYISKITDNTNNYFLSLVKNLKIVHINREEQYESDLANSYLNDSYKQTTRLNKSLSALFPIISIVKTIGIVLVLLITFHMINDKILTAGAFTIAYLYVQKLYTPISGFSRYAKLLAEGDKALSRLFEINFCDYKIRMNGIKNIDSAPIIETKNLSFNYGEKVIYKNLNLIFNSNELTVVKSESGKGKSTLMKLLLGLLSPNSGEILINGEKSSEYDISSVGVLFQDIQLFNRSFIENVTYGNKNYSKEKLNILIKELNLTHLIEKNGIEFLINSNNSNLSGGEKRRICLLRTLLKETNVYILDEPTSEIDYENSKRIIEYIYTLRKDKTIIVFTHDSQFDSYADNIVVL